ncbi:hypothetical protein AB0M22_09390 [Nocardia sp. NPDC051756]|uniref:hypothetical protein n=1 Tax=Nocardia sp. NPDC051756 TaxID=3154751 RepID=UPI00341FF58D
MATTLPTPGTARPMSGVAYNEDNETIPLAACYELTPPLRHDGRTDRYAMVTLGGIWGCDALCRLLGSGHLLSKRHGTPAQDLALLGYEAQS